MKFIRGLAIRFGKMNKLGKLMENPHELGQTYPNETTDTGKSSQLRNDGCLFCRLIQIICPNEGYVIPLQQT